MVSSNEQRDLERPPDYKGKLYLRVTKKHWNYLKALGKCGDRPVKWNPAWKKAYKSLTGIDSNLAPGTMISGVFRARGWIEKIGKRSPFKYKITPEGRSALLKRPLLESNIRDSCRQANDTNPITLEETEKASQPTKEEAQLQLQSFQAFAPESTVKNVRRYERSKIGQALKVLYDGHCQICGFTFSKRDGTHFSEVHHLEKLSDGGWEKPINMIVVCANHHRMLHYGKVE